VHIKLIGIENNQETFTMWILFGVSLIPLVVYSAYLIRGIPESHKILAMNVEKIFEGWNELLPS
jgi:hypothetical protein